MGTVFLKLLNMSIAAGWLILAVLLLRLLLKRVPKWIHCLLWGIVAIRLLCPFTIESTFSLIPSAETIQTNAMSEGRVYAYVPTIDSKISVIEHTVNPALHTAFAYQEEDSAAPLQIYTYIAGLVWGFGVLLLIAYAILSRFKIRHMIKEAVRHSDNIYLCDAVTSPFILGIVRPRIYLPSGMDAEQADYVIAHEQAHLKRKDYLLKPIGYFLLIVYWFQPLCWVAYTCFCKDIELACDEKVIKNMTLKEKKGYASALLSCSQQRRTVMVCPLAFGEVGVKKRIKSVLHYKKTAVWILTSGLVICAIVGICFLTDPPKEYQIRVTVPAGCMGEFSYSDEEISPKNSTLTIYAGEGLGDTEAVLLPTEVKEENAYDETVYLTPGMPVKFEVEKGAWFKIGVNVQNPTAEDKNVYVSVKNVDVRIAAAAGANVALDKEAGLIGGEKPDEESNLAGGEKSDMEQNVPDNDKTDSGENMPGGEKFNEEQNAPDSAAVVSITVINGNNGERLTYHITDSSNEFGDLLELYEQLDFSAETEENSRIGYHCSMMLYDENGEALHSVTPYKDGFTVDRTFYKYTGSSGLDMKSVALMNYIDLLFYPADEQEAEEEERSHSMMLDEEEKMNDTIGMQIVLPAYTETDIVYYKSDNAVEIQYHDKILDTDCTLQAVRNGTIELPEITFDSTQEEDWEGRTADNQLVHVKVRRSEDGKTVIASWKYGECEFVIQGTVEGKDTDIGAIPKTALYMIQNY